MGALGTDRNTLRKGIDRIVCDNALIAANTTIFNGAIVATNAAGDLVPASDTAGLTVQGRARQAMKNTTGAPVAIDPPSGVEAGVFKYDTSGGSAITKADVGQNCFILDDHTVVRAGGTVHAIVCGIVDSIDSDGGVWVKINY